MSLSCILCQPLIYWFEPRGSHNPMRFSRLRLCSCLCSVFLTLSRSMFLSATNAVMSLYPSLLYLSRYFINCFSCFSFDLPDGRWHDSIGLSPSRLHCDRTANYGSIIIPVPIVAGSDAIRLLQSRLYRSLIYQCHGAPPAGLTVTVMYPEDRYSVVNDHRGFSPSTIQRTFFSQKSTLTSNIFLIFYV